MFVRLLVSVAFSCRPIEYCLFFLVVYFIVHIEINFRVKLVFNIIHFWEILINNKYSWVFVVNIKIIFLKSKIFLLQSEEFIFHNISKLCLNLKSIHFPNYYFSVHVWFVDDAKYLLRPSINYGKPAPYKIGHILYPSGLAYNSWVVPYNYFIV